MSTSTYKQSQPPASGMIPRLSVPHNYKGGIHNENIQGYWANSCYVNRRVCNRRRGSHLLSHESARISGCCDGQCRCHSVGEKLRPLGAPHIQCVCKSTWVYQIGRAHVCTPVTW